MTNNIKVKNTNSETDPNQLVGHGKRDPKKNETTDKELEEIARKMQEYGGRPLGGEGGFH